jgi:hypothetical protein
MHALTGWRITQRNEVVGMSGSGGTFVLVATYPDEVTAREDYQVVKDTHAAGLPGSCDAAAVTMDASSMVHENKDEPTTRHGAGRHAATGAAIGVPPPVLGSAAAGGAVSGVGGHLARGCRGQKPKSSAISSPRARPGWSQSGRAKSKTRSGTP